MTCHNNIFLRGDLFRYVSHKAKSFPSNILEFVQKKYLNLLEKKRGQISQFFALKILKRSKKFDEIMMENVFFCLSLNTQFKICCTPKFTFG